MFVYLLLLNCLQLGDMDFWPNSGNCPMPGTEWTMYPCGFSHMRATVSFDKHKLISSSNILSVSIKKLKNFWKCLK